jgi:GDPmannose 4,6-dehydratase
MPIALITGIHGQDGSFLAPLLLERGYRVVGIDLEKRPAAAGVEVLQADVTDAKRVAEVVATVRPHEIYHFAGQSSVWRSLAEPEQTFLSTAVSTLNVLEAVRRERPETRVFIAASGEVFGDTAGAVANESTPLQAASPYAAAKSAAVLLTQTYRVSYGLFCCAAFFYNHESPRRPETFVTRKIVRAACRIARGLADHVELGDTSVIRDWGWAPEYVDAAFRMLQASAPEDLVIATGESCSLEHFLERTFASLGLDHRVHVVKSPAHVRTAEIHAMYADPTRAAERLGWRATTRVNAVIDRLIEAELRALDSEAER